MVGAEDEASRAANQHTVVVETATAAATTVEVKKEQTHIMK